MKQKEDPTKPRFYIDKRGNWFQDGIKIKHRLTYLYNNKLLSRDDEGRYYLDEGSGKLYIEVEDTPFVVKMVDKKGDDFYIILNDETVEKLDLNTVNINHENIPYAKIKNRKFEARFLRPAYYEFMKYLKKEDDNYFIMSKGGKHVLKKIT
ncbi:MAG: DUF1285 domain-containing protein [Candidatus Dadabacteria bacterium]|jgi:hypothetical protein|nr:DUF1285 domain-containing protein [Candidatus Dadabacteria bacterium]MCZ6684391.1 DUF1285 domain-containing protein [Candidatus Dadabacteria bacterium]MCZ6791422.1 DUF1285 domain-containing protein [Candidatus Dadabacteria bacterium]TDI92330.1 MAG: DUF1285 domain-containing protein [Candidatus Dadabacteria bacterium]TDJ02023.1 MAG: DUF1285 domain-containing protein [Candidatus Dadabacteria bacterium]